MNYFIYLFPFAIIGLWILVTFIVAKTGWNALSENYSFEDEFIGTKVGLISAGINRANYNSSLILKYNEKGIYLKTIFIFRLFHPPILIPWKEINKVRDKTVLIVTLKELVIGNPQVATICLNEHVYNKIKDNLYQGL